MSCTRGRDRKRPRDGRVLEAASQQLGCSPSGLILSLTVDHVCLSFCFPSSHILSEL